MTPARAIKITSKRLEALGRAKNGFAGTSNPVGGKRPSAVYGKKSRVPPVRRYRARQG